MKGLVEPGVPRAEKLVDLAKQTTGGSERDVHAGWNGDRVPFESERPNASLRGGSALNWFCPRTAGGVILKRYARTGKGLGERSQRLIVLHAGNPAEVVSASSFEVLLGEPARRVIIFSGLAKPGIRVNHDEEAYQNEVLVKLGVTVFGLESAAVDVGLASVQNDETAFRLELNTAKLEVDPATSELQLRVLTTLMGEETWLHQFSYQIVAHVMKAAARISGVIRFPRGVFDLAHQLRGERTRWCA